MNERAPKTWVISANFRPPRASLQPTDLERSLTRLNFENYLIFDHKRKERLTSSESVSGSLLVNPMGRFPKLIRFVLRKIPILAGIVASLVRRVPTLNFLMIPHNLRLFTYNSILGEIPDEDFVFLVDSRDLIFQVDPRAVSSQLTKQAELHFFTEGEVYFKGSTLQKIGQSESNLNWIRLLKNNSDLKLDEIYDASIINGGCIAGNVKAVKKMLGWSCKELLLSEHFIETGLDQAVINWGVYTNSLPKLKLSIHKNGKFVLNMCGVIEPAPIYSDGILSLGSLEIPIVHQYDRFGQYCETCGLTLNKSKYVYPTR